MPMTLGVVDFSRLNFVRIPRTAFVGHFDGVIAFLCELPHYKDSTLYKSPKNNCKNNLERATDPNDSIFFTSAKYRN